MADEQFWIHPDVEAAVNADDSIRPEAKGLLVQSVSKAVGTTGDPEVVRRAIDEAKAGEYSRFLKPPDPPEPEPGSLADAAARFKAAQGRYPAMGLKPVDSGPTVQGVADPNQAPPPVPTGLPPIADQLARFAQFRSENQGVGLKRVDPPKKGS